MRTVRAFNPGHHTRISVSICRLLQAHHRKRHERFQSRKLAEDEIDDAANIANHEGDDEDACAEEPRNDDDNPTLDLDEAFVMDETERFMIHEDGLFAGQLADLRNYVMKSNLKSPPLKSHLHLAFGSPARRAIAQPLEHVGVEVLARVATARVPLESLTEVSRRRYRGKLGRKKLRY